MVWLVWRKAAKSKWSTVWVNLPGLTLEVEGENGKTVINFDNAIIAAGSRPIQLPFIPHEDPRIWDSTDALELKEVPERLLVMGGGIIGLEMGTVYHALGSQIDVVEMFDQLSRQLTKTSLKSSPSVSARNST